MNTKQRLRNEADKLWKLKVMEKSAICEVCNEEPTITGHHYYYKSNYPHLRYDLDNGIPIGISCHFTCHHKDPKIIEDKIIAKKGDQWLHLLKVKAYNKPSFQTIGWYKSHIENLK